MSEEQQKEVLAFLEKIACLVDDLKNRKLIQFLTAHEVEDVFTGENVKKAQELMARLEGAFIT